MNTWKFFDITHRDHLLCNPTSIEKLDRVIDLLDLPPGAHVLDIASGKGEFLLRVAERYAAPGTAELRGVAVEISPFHVAELRASVAARAPHAQLNVLQMDAAEYHAEPDAFDLASCIGASWIYGGHAGTLAALSAAVRPGAQILVGEPFWLGEPDPAYLAAAGVTREEFGTHVGNVQAGVDLGLVPLLALVSSGDDWDVYETLQWRAAARYAAANAGDPDVPELLERVARSRDAYLRWGREALGWALYLFGRPLRSAPE